MFAIFEGGAVIASEVFGVDLGVTAMEGITQAVGEETLATLSEGYELVKKGTRVATAMGSVASGLKKITGVQRAASKTLDFVQNAHSMGDMYKSESVYNTPARTRPKGGSNLSNQKPDQHPRLSREQYLQKEDKWSRPKVSIPERRLPPGLREGPRLPTISRPGRYGETFLPNHGIGAAINRVGANRFIDTHDVSRPNGRGMIGDMVRQGTKTLYDSNSTLREDMTNILRDGSRYTHNMERLPMNHAPESETHVGTYVENPNFPRASDGSALPPDILGMGAWPTHASITQGPAAPLSFGSNQVGASNPNYSNWSSANLAAM